MSDQTLIERARILAAHQRNLDLTAGKKVAAVLDELCDYIIKIEGIKTLKPTTAMMRKEWRDAGGSVHGPNIETVTMPEEAYFKFRWKIGNHA